MKYIKMKPADRRKILKAKAISDYEIYKKRVGKKESNYEQPKEFILEEVDILKVPKEKVPKKTYRRGKVKVDKKDKATEVKVDVDI
jgi:hypothetical protein